MLRTCIGFLLALFWVSDLPAQITIPNQGWTRRPTRETPAEPLEWGLEAAGHLMRRAGFGASPEELEVMVAQGFEATLDELINFEEVDDSALEAALEARDYEFIRYNNNDQPRINSNNVQSWWLFRMLNSRRQMIEKMTLFWHDHFATSAATVFHIDGNQEPLMLVQNRTLREHALGNFREMVRAIARDPAMIIWLDNYTNVVGNPNENWARELMELFTMGEGNGYTEFDIQEAARAFTGWTLVPPRRPGLGTPLTFRFEPRLHDEGPKLVLGTEIEGASGPAGIEDGDRVINVLFEQPVVAEYLVGKLWNFFVYPDPEPLIVQNLADLFRESDYEMKPLMRAIFSHPHFLSRRALRAKIKSPVEFTVGAYHHLGVTNPDNLPRLTLLYGLNQSLFLPPDVGGWTQDEGWINTGTILGRANFMTFMTANRPGEPIQIVGSDRVIQNPVPDQIPLNDILQDNALETAEQVVEYFLRTLVQGAVSVDTRYALEDYLRRGADGEPREFDIQDPLQVDEKVRGLIFLVSLLPAYQLN